MKKGVLFLIAFCFLISSFGFTQEKKNMKTQENVNEYASAKTVEIGGMVWNSIKAFRGGNDEQYLWINLFTNFFVVDSVMLGLKSDFDYYLDSGQYKLKIYFTPGAAFALEESSVFMNINLNIGYMQNTSTDTSYLAYGNEIGIKIKLREGFLLGINTTLFFYTSLSGDAYNDELINTLSLSGYF